MDNDDSKNLINDTSKPENNTGVSNNVTEDDTLVNSKRNKENSKPIKNKNTKGKKSHWAIKATIITFFLSAFFSFISELTANAHNIYLSLFLLLFLIVGSIIFDGIGVAVAACDVAPLTAMASKKIKGSKMALKLVNHADIVANVCNDVIGDIFGVMSGACTMIIVVVITVNMPSLEKQIITIVISAVVSALIVGGKAFLKNYAIYKSKEVVMMTAKFLSIFIPEEKNKKKKKNKKQ